MSPYPSRIEPKPYRAINDKLKDLYRWSQGHLSHEDYHRVNGQIAILKWALNYPEHLCDSCDHDFATCEGNASFLGPDFEDEVQDIEPFRPEDNDLIYFCPEYSKKPQVP